MRHSWIGGPLAHGLYIRGRTAETRWLNQNGFLTFAGAVQAVKSRARAAPRRHTGEGQTNHWFQMHFFLPPLWTRAAEYVGAPWCLRSCLVPYGTLARSFAWLGLGCQVCIDYAALHWRKVSCVQPRLTWRTRTASKASTHPQIWWLLWTNAQASGL